MSGHNWADPNYFTNGKSWSENYRDGEAAARAERAVRQSSPAMKALHAFEAVSVGYLLAKHVGRQDVREYIPVSPVPATQVPSNLVIIPLNKFIEASLVDEPQNKATGIKDTVTHGVVNLLSKALHENKEIHLSWIEPNGDIYSHRYTVFSIGDGMARVVPSQSAPIPGIPEGNIMSNDTSVEADVQADNDLFNAILDVINQNRSSLDYARNRYSLANKIMDAVKSI